MRVFLIACLLAIGFASQDANGFQDVNPFDRNIESASTTISTKPVGSKIKQDPKDEIVIALSADKKNSGGLSTTGQNDRRTLELLQQNVTMKFSEAEFRNVRQVLTKQIAVPIILDISAQDDSLTDDELVSLNIKDVRLSTALRMMLLEKNATYMVDDGVLRIISMDVKNDPEYFRRHSFDCRELLALIKKNETAFPSEELGFYSMPGGFGGSSGGPANSGGVFNTPVVGPQGLQGGSGGGLGGGGGIQKKGGGFGGGGGAQQTGGGGFPVTQQKRVPTPASQKLIELIKLSVSPDNWDDTNGDGTIMAIGGVLVVSSDEETLQGISDLLEDLGHIYSSSNVPAETGFDEGTFGLEATDAGVQYYPAQPEVVTPPEPPNRTTKGGVDLEIEK